MTEPVIRTLPLRIPTVLFVKLHLLDGAANIVISLFDVEFRMQPLRDSKAFYGSRCYAGRVQLALETMDWHGW